MLDPPAPPRRSLSSRGPPPPQLVAGTEGPPRARQHDRPDRGIVLTARKCLEELHARLMVDGVQLLRPIQRNPRDRSRLLEHNKAWLRTHRHGICLRIT